jgi:hypothetical protein
MFSCLIQAFTFFHRNEVLTFGDRLINGFPKLGSFPTSLYHLNPPPCSHRTFRLLRPPHPAKLATLHTVPRINWVELLEPSDLGHREDNVLWIELVPQRACLRGREPGLRRWQWLVWHLFIWYSFLIEERVRSAI